MNRRVCLELLNVATEPVGGLSLVRESGARLARGTIYVLLTSLEDDGYVRSFQPASGERRFYEITSAGRAALLRSDL